jgi:undecaprenyl-diphosphatase
MSMLSMLPYINELPRVLEMSQQALQAAPVEQVGAGPGLSVLQGAILGLVEGITEYLPVSSTGHLLIASDLMRLERTGVSKANIDAFNIVIQGGAILAVAGLYFPRFLQMLRGLLGRDALGLRLFICVVIAFLPAAVVGLLVHDWLEAHLFNTMSVAAALFVGGLFMIAIDRLIIRPRRQSAQAGASDPALVGHELDRLTPTQALVVGLLQLFALIPGTSRSMMTISGGVIVGLRPAAAAEFSFLLGMPTLLAASAYALYKNLKHAKQSGTPNLFQEIGWAPTIVGLLVATVSAALAVRWLVGFLNRQGLTPFGIYRIALAAVLLTLFWQGLVNVN